MISMLQSIFLQGVQRRPHGIFALHGVNLLDMIWVVYEYYVTTDWANEANYRTIFVKEH